MLIGDDRARREWLSRHPEVRVIDLNTMSNPVRGYRDEAERIRCLACGNLFMLDPSMLSYVRLPDGSIDPSPYTTIEQRITGKHLELCEGDAAVTLWKIDQWFKGEVAA